MWRSSKGRPKRRDCGCVFIGVGVVIWRLEEVVGMSRALSLRCANGRLMLRFAGVVAMFGMCVFGAACVR